MNKIVSVEGLPTVAVTHLRCRRLIPFYLCKAVNLFKILDMVYGNN